MGQVTRTPNPDDPIDRAVLEFQQGTRSEENFEVIVERFYDPVKSFFLKRCISIDDCLDLNQKTFLKVYTGLEGFEWKSSFSTWMFTIATNVYRNRLKGDSRRWGDPIGPTDGGDSPNASGEEGEPVLREAREDPLEELLSKEQRRLLREAVDELPSQMRACVALRLRDRKYKEIAEELELSIGTVKAHLHEAKKKLQASLGDIFDGIDF